MNIDGRTGLSGLEAISKADRPVHRDAFTLAACHAVTKGARRISSWQHACLHRKSQLREKKQAYR
jgi:hypothetical protein